MTRMWLLKLAIFSASSCILVVEALPGHSESSDTTKTHGWQWTKSTATQTSPTPTLINSPSSGIPSITTNVPETTLTSSSVPVCSSCPCAIVSSLVATATIPIPTIPAQIAWDCLQSVPLNATAAVPWLESMKPYIEWQTTLAYLKSPPPGYLEQAIDVWAQLESIIDGINSFADEYELEFALYELLQRTHDRHFVYAPNLIYDVLTFGRPLALVSVSINGQELPKPYVYTDILLSATTGFEPSAVSSIDGIDTITYLEDLSQYGSLQDPDALYNNLFYNLAQISLGSSGTGAGVFAGGGRGRVVYPGAFTVLAFENGTSTTYENFARVLQDFVNVTTGKDVYDRYVAPPPKTTTSTAAASTSAPTSTPTPAPGYPAPVLRQINNLVGGYYLDTPGYEDCAVLSVPSFVSLFSAEQSFQDVALNFINQSKIDGKTKLIIDVSANGGGTILQGYSLFTNLFPDLFPYGATRFRAHEAFNIIGQTVSDVAGPVYPWNLTDPPGPDDLLNYFAGTPFDYRADVNINYENFTSWPEKYGPHEFYGDNFTSIIRWNLSDPISIDYGGIIVNGFQNRTGIVPNRPFEEENIVILYDGYCASTCTIFSEFMTEQAGVKTVAVGGRPLYGPMQAVGGVKGANDYSWEGIYDFVNATFALGTPEQQIAWKSTELGLYSTLPLQRAVVANVNVRDNIRQGDETQTPLQFIYQAADCRIWYEPSFTYDVTTMWRKVYDVTWNGASCAAEQSPVTKRTANRMNSKRAMSEEVMKQLVEGINLSSDRPNADIAREAFMRP